MSDPAWALEVGVAPEATLAASWDAPVRNAPGPQADSAQPGRPEQAVEHRQGKPSRHDQGVKGFQGVDQPGC